MWVRHFQTIEELRQALLEFRETYNATWLIERHGFMSPAEFRQRQLQPVAEAAYTQGSLISASLGIRLQFGVSSTVGAIYRPFAHSRQWVTAALLAPRETNALIVTRASRSSRVILLSAHLGTEKHRLTNRDTRKSSCRLIRNMRRRPTVAWRPISVHVPLDHAADAVDAPTCAGRQLVQQLAHRAVVQFDSRLRPNSRLQIDATQAHHAMLLDPRGDPCQLLGGEARGLVEQPFRLVRIVARDPVTQSLSVHGTSFRYGAS